MMFNLIFLIASVGFSIAEEVGYIYIINQSGSNWKLTHRESHFTDCLFPDLLKNGDTKLVSIKFGNSFLPFLSFLSHARVDYELTGTGGRSFQILFRGKPTQLEAVYSNLEIDGQPKGSIRSLGWRDNGVTNFIIIGRNGDYTGTSMDGTSWMKNNIDTLGNRTLKQITIPGSHDSGMSVVDGRTGFFRDCNVLTQSHAVGEQLNLGIRYLDIRPVISNGGEYLTGKYSHIEGNSWIGGNGQSIPSIVTELNLFTKDHKELILIKLSNSLNTDLGLNNYRGFNQSEWERMFQKLDMINFLYYNGNSNVHLEDITLGDYTNYGTRASVVIIVNDPDTNVQLGPRLGKGYFMPSSLDIYSEYSHTNDWIFMMRDQLGKMYFHSRSEYVLLSWILTPNASQAFECKPSVKELAEQANMYLGWPLYNEVISTTFPNIILVDDVSDTDVALMALALSTKKMLT